MQIQDGNIAHGDFKSKCCNKKVTEYRSDTYPYDCGYECSKCGESWSVLQISRGQHLKDPNT